MRTRNRPIALAVFACLILSSSARSASFDEGVVFVSGTEGYHTFRIPAIVRANNGDLLAFAEGRVNSARDHDDVDLVLKRSADNGATWGPLQTVWGKDDGDLITWGNPCPVVDRASGRIWLPLCWENYRIFVMHSDDNGVSWSRPNDITSQAWNPAWPRPPEPTLAVWTGPGVGIQVERGVHAGRLVIPMHLRRHPLRGAEANEVAVFYSDDHGTTWRYSENTTGMGNEPQVVELADGRLMLNQRHQIARDLRSEALRYRLISHSQDGGATWSPSTPDDELADPTVQASLLRYRWPDEDPRDPRGLLLFANPAAPNRRESMTVRASFDDGVTWSASRLVRAGFSAYSSLVRQADGSIGLLYETERYKTIHYARFDPAWLEGASPAGRDAATKDSSADPDRGGQAGWRRLADLPGTEGVAGPFVGAAGGGLIVAGGTNFIDGRPWSGGHKTWHDIVYGLETPGGEWSIVGRLPRRLGYGAAVPWEGSLLCLGGGDAEDHYAETFRLQYINGSLSISAHLPLPERSAYHAAILLGNRLYVVGGQDSPHAPQGRRSFWRLDLGRVDAAWERLEPWPGSGRLMPVIAALGESLFLFGGYDLVADASGATTRTFLRDAYRYDPDGGWTRCAAPPRPVVGAPSPALPIDGTHLALLGWNDGRLGSIQPPESRPDFPADLLIYDAAADRWTISGRVPFPNKVTPVVRWRDRWVVASGETQPGIRTPCVWSIAADALPSLLPRSDAVFR